MNKQEIKDKIKRIESYIKNSGDADPRDAYEIRHWKQDLIELNKLLNE